MYVKISTVHGILICKNIKNIKNLELNEYLCEQYSIKNIYINILIEKKLMYYNFADVSLETYSYIEDNNVIISDSYNIYDIETILKFKLDVTKQYIGALFRANRNDTLQHLYKHKNYKNKIIKMLEDDCISKNYYYPYIFYTGLCKGSSLILEWCEENNTMPIKYFNTSKYSHILDIGSSNGVIHILDWFIKSGLKYGFELKYSDNALNSASGSGYTNVLDWWFNSGLELKYSERALDRASKNNHINVLDWWLNSGLELKYSEDALDWASKNGHINVLDWWKNTGLPIKCSLLALKYAISNNHYHVLEWWKNNGLISISKYIETENNIENEIKSILDSASQFGNLNILEWWKNSGLPFHYSQSINLASNEGHVHILEWFLHSNLPLEYDEKALQYASHHSHINVLEWWKNSGLPLKYDYLTMVWVNIDVLEWWKNSGLPLKYSEVSIDSVSRGYYESIKVLEWWKNSGLELKYSQETLNNCSPSTLKWWLESKLPIK